MTYRITVDANLFRIAYACVSTEETRYYLNGVYITPAPRGQRGALLVSTDGHRLLVVHDEGATLDSIPKGGLIIHVKKPQLAQMKTAKGYNQKRMTLSPSDNGNPIVEFADVITATKERPEQVKPAGSAYLEWIDGSFPDFMRVIPRIEEHGSFGAFNADYAADFAEVGKELRKHFNKASRVAPMSISGQGNANAPALVGWGNMPALGVLMPMHEAVVTFPSWLNAKHKAQEPA